MFKTKLPLYQIDAFTDQTFKGNPAAVCPLDSWIKDELLQSIARENNLSETAFLVGSEDGFELRWFTPVTEVALCGHATLASAHILFDHLEHQGETIEFRTMSGELTVWKDGPLLVMDFPSRPGEPTAAPEALTSGLGCPLDEVLSPRDCGTGASMWSDCACSDRPRSSALHPVVHR